MKWEDFAKVEKIGGLDAIVAEPKIISDIEAQNNHALYKAAAERFERAQQEQNAKAAAKYPEPLNPDSWTAEELGDHMAQERVDEMRYSEALVAKCRKLEEENATLRLEIDFARSELLGIGIQAYVMGNEKIQIRAVEAGERMWRVLNQKEGETSSKA